MRILFTSSSCTSARLPCRTPQAEAAVLHSTMRSIATVLAFLACASALSVPAQCALRQPAVQRARTPHAMLEPVATLSGLEQLAESPAAAGAGLPTSAVLADVLDVVQGFADSPLILLVPIGAGTLVASIIIAILVKSAG